jgi:hypothetical protein
MRRCDENVDRIVMIQRREQTRQSPHWVRIAKLDTHRPRMSLTLLLEGNIGVAQRLRIGSADPSRAASAAPRFQSRFHTDPGLISSSSTGPNHGIRMEPYLAQAITDRDGSLLEERRPQPKDAIRADTAYVMTNLMQGVVQHGTAAAANALNWPLAGKTGTVDDNTDAWFVGFDPNITVGVWMGIMKVYIELYGDRANPPKFESPGNIVFMPVDRMTGEPASAESGAIVNEAFISGTQPVKQ